MVFLGGTQKVGNSTCHFNGIYHRVGSRTFRVDLLSSVSGTPAIGMTVEPGLIHLYLSAVLAQIHRFEERGLHILPSCREDYDDCC